MATSQMGYDGTLNEVAVEIENARHEEIKEARLRKFSGITNL